MVCYAYRRYSQSAKHAFCFGPFRRISYVWLSLLQVCNRNILAFSVPVKTILFFVIAFVHNADHCCHGKVSCCCCSTNCCQIIGAYKLLLQSKLLLCCSTNMSIQDADCLGQCLEAQPDDPVAALHKYQQERIPQTTKEACSRLSAHHLNAHSCMSAC